ARGYRAIVLPGVERIPDAALGWLEEFSRGGGAVIATRRLPDLAPGFLATETDHAQVRDRVRRLFEGPGARGMFVGDEAALAAALRRASRPDVALDPPAPDVGFVHRRTDDADIYFIANTSNMRQKVTATFRIDAAAAETWSLFDGTTAAQPARWSRAGATVDLDLEPYGSRVFVFSRNEVRLRSPANLRSYGATRGASSAAITDLSAAWRVTFPNGPTVTMERLRSWTDDEATRYFSGVATYEKDVTVSDAIARAARVVLDFGEGTPVAPQPLRSGMQAWLDAPVR